MANRCLIKIYCNLIKSVILYIIRDKNKRWDEKMKKAIKAIFLSIFTVCLNINYVSAVPLPGIGPFVTYNPEAEQQTWIKQPVGSNWCVRACTDVALSYLQVLQGNGTIGAGGGTIVPGVITQEQAAHTPLNITMQFNQIRPTIAQFSHNNPQITCTRKVIVPNIHTIQQAYNEIHNALNAAQLQQIGQQIPNGHKPGIAILHFQGGGHDHACITYGINATSIDVYDPMPGRNNFNVTRNAFRYMVGVVPRVLTEYCLIQW